MGIRFSADEVFAMSERMEENGARFYRRAAELHPTSEKENIEFLLGLAAMEDQHLATFSEMRASLPGDMKESTAFDPYMESVLYLSTMADQSAAEGAPSVTDSLTGAESIEEILRIAIGLEEKAIIFYVGMKDMVPDRLGKDKLDAIIAEEKSHIATLAKELQKTRGQ